MMRNARRARLTTGAAAALIQLRRDWSWVRDWPWIGLLWVVVTLVLGVAFQALDSRPLQMALLGVAIICVVALRHDVFTAAFLIGVELLFDWYQLIPLPHGFPFVYLIIAVALIGLIALARRAERPWAWLPRVDLGLWAAFILLAALAMHRSLNHFIAQLYLIEVVVSAFVLWTLGTLVATEPSRVRRLFQWLSLLAALIAIHSIILGTTGVFLLDTPKLDAYLASKDINYFRLLGSGAIRASSFLLNPDSDGAFLAMMVFLQAGLAMASAGWRARAYYLMQAALILVALVFTYTTAAWIAFAGGTIVFILLAVRGRVRFYTLGALAGAVGMIYLLLPRQVHLLFGHASASGELSLRAGIWQTAIRIIRAHPLTGIGLGSGGAYILASAPYREQTKAVAHPHNSYLELAAMAGIPVLLFFLALLGSALVRAARNYRLGDGRLRALLGGALAGLAALSIHAFADATWTLPPLVPIAWLLVGAISSKALTRVLANDAAATAHGASAPELPPQPEQLASSWPLPAGGGEV